LADSSSFRWILKRILQLIESNSQSTQLASKLNCYSRKTGTIHSKNIAIKLISKRRPFGKQKEYLTTWTFYFLPSAQKSRYSLNALIGRIISTKKKMSKIGYRSRFDASPLEACRASWVSYLSVPFFLVPCRGSLAATCKVLVLHQCRTRASHFSSCLVGGAWLQPAKSSRTFIFYLGIYRVWGLRVAPPVLSMWPSKLKNLMKKSPFLDLCVSSLRRGHANLLCIVPILSDVSKETSDEEKSKHFSLAQHICGTLQRLVKGTTQLKTCLVIG